MNTTNKLTVFYSPNFFEEKIQIFFMKKKMFAILIEGFIELFPEKERAFGQTY